MKAICSVIIMIGLSLATVSYSWSFYSNPDKTIFKYIKKKKHGKLESLLSSDPEQLKVIHPQKKMDPLIYSLNKRNHHSLKILIEKGFFNDFKSQGFGFWVVALKNHDWQSFNVLLSFFELIPQGSKAIEKWQDQIFKHGWVHLSETGKIKIEEILGYEQVTKKLRQNSEEAIIELLSSEHRDTLKEYLDRTNSSILLWAIEHDFIELVKAALRLGAPLDARKMDLSPLQAALLGEKIEIAILLIFNGAKIDEELQFGKHQMSFLHYAIEKKHDRLAKALISMGANLNKKNSQGLSVKDIIKNEKLYTIASYVMRQKLINRLHMILSQHLPSLDIESYTSPEAKIHYYKLFDGSEQLKGSRQKEQNCEDSCPICFEPGDEGGLHHCMNGRCNVGGERFKICLSCLKDSLKVQIKDYAYPLHCDNCGVEQIFSKEEITEMGLREHIEDIELNTYLAYFKAMFPTSKNCSTPNCSNLIRETECDGEGHYKCLCEQSYCFACGENHRGLDCKTYAESMKLIAQNPFGPKIHDPASDLRPCPYCYKPFTKDDKCNYVICPNCKNKWDFIKGKWKFGADHNHRTDGFNENWKTGKRTYRIPGDIDTKTGKPYTQYTEGVYE